MFNGAILSGGALHGLIQQAIKDKYVSILDREECTKWLSKKFIPETQKALALLIFFDKLYLPSAHMGERLFDLDGLRREGLIKEIGKGFDEEYISPVYSQTAKQNIVDSKVFHTLNYLKPLLRRHIYHIMKDSGQFDGMRKGFEAMGLNYSYYHCNRFTGEILKFIEARLDANKISNSQAGHWWRAIVTDKDENSVVYAHMVIMDILHDCYMFDQSSMNKWPIISDSFDPQAVRLCRLDSLKSSSDAHELLNTFNLFKLVMYDIRGYRPSINSIQDILRLRQDKRIRRFRKRFAQFIQCITDGDFKNIGDMRLAVVDASNSLKRIEPFEKLTRWTTYLSLPISVAESLLGFPVLGVSTALIAGTAQAIIDYSKVRHDWILFGQGM